MSRFPTVDFSRHSGGRIVSEDPSCDLIVWFCDATLVGVCFGKFGQAKKSKQPENLIQIETVQEEALTQLWGLPLTRQHLKEALTAACKQVVHLLRNTAHYGSDSVGVKTQIIIKQAFRRVFRFLYGKDAQEEDDITTIIQKISGRASALDGIRNHIVLTATMWISCCLLQQQSMEALLKYAKRILDAGSEKDGSGLQGRDASHLKQETTENSGLMTNTQLRGIIIYLNICALIQAEEWMKCVDVIKSDLDFIPSELQDQAQYLKAYSLYYHGNYTHAVETCKMLLEMISQDGMSGQVYNLIGCCLRQMDKPHMALQQLRKALTVSSIISPSSLFNVSVIYRDLGEEEAEMESLQLLEKALDPSVDVSDGDEGDADTSSGPAWPVVVLVPTQRAKEGSIHPVQALSHIAVLYTLARRNLDLNRIEKAAERYLDLLSILETSSVAVDEDGHGRNMLLPSLQTIYLDAATSLLKADRTEEALAICDKLLSKSKLLHHEEALSLETSTQESEEETQRGCSRYPFLVPYADISSEERSKLERSSCKATQESADGGALCDEDIRGCSSGPGMSDILERNEMQRVGNGGDVGHLRKGVHDKGHLLSTQTVGFRKRQREWGVERDPGDVSSRTFENDLDNGKDEDDGRRRREELKEEVTYTAHALILQAQCLFKQGNERAAITEVDHALEILQTGSTDGSQVDEKLEEDAGNQDGSMAKRRKIGSDSDCIAISDDRGSSLPDKKPTHTAVMKSSAYHLKASVLISQGQLHDAMNTILMSLHCCPNNIDTLKTHAVLLEKLGRKSEAVKAWSRLKDTKASGQIVHCL